jgi:hypothetical protein
MSNPGDYDAQVEEIQDHNQPLLEGFRTWLEASGASKDAIEKHVETILFFAEYLVYYEPLKRLDMTTGPDIGMFFSDWFPRQAAWSSSAGESEYLAAFEIFFRWMGETGGISPEVAAGILAALEDRDGLIPNRNDCWIA